MRCRQWLVWIMSMPLSRIRNSRPDMVGQWLQWMVQLGTLRCNLEVALRVWTLGREIEASEGGRDNDQDPLEPDRTRFKEAMTMR